MTWRTAVRRTAEVGARVTPVRAALRRVADRLPERALRGMPIDDEFVVRIDSDHTFRYAGGPHDAVGRFLYWHGLRRWERETWPVFLPLARRARGFLDVGAFTGAYTLVAATVNPTLRVVAFEPVPATYARLVDNVRLNGIEGRVTALAAAVGNEVGTGRFFLPDRPMPDTGFLDLSDREPKEQGSWVDVAVTTIDKSVPEDLHVDLVKIDVEDAEGPVVESMADMLARHRPSVVIEMLASGSWERAVEVFADLGYEFLHLTCAGPVQVAQPRPIAADSSMNWLMRPT